MNIGLCYVHTLRCLRSLNVFCLLSSYCKQDHFENYEWRRASWYNSYINQGYKAAFAYPASAFTAWYKVDIGMFSYVSKWSVKEPIPLSSQHTYMCVVKGYFDFPENICKNNSTNSFLRMKLF